MGVLHYGLILCYGIVRICCVLVALWILILGCGLVRMWCALEDLLFFFYFFLVFLSCLDLDVSVVMGVGLNSPLWEGQRSPG